MKTLVRILAAFAAVCLMSTAALAADASPAGTWKYTQQSRGGNQGVERTLVLEAKDGTLTGTLKGASFGQFEIPDRPIEEASFKNGEIAFTVTMEFNGNKRVSKYTGKLEGDTITGSIEAPGRDGNVQKRDWVAKRAM